MRDGTFFLRSIFLCFLFEANEVGLPVATWARHSDTKGTLTSHSQSRTTSLQHPLDNHPHHPPSASPKANMHTCNDTRAQMQTCSYTHTVYESARAISWTHTLGRCLQHIHYQSRRPVYFYCLKTASIHYPKIFFFCLSLVFFFFPLHALRSPTNELNTEETWKRLDEAWQF